MGAKLALLIKRGTRLRVFVNRVLKGIFGTRRDEVIGG
jgi:hypothetical protein